MKKVLTYIVGFLALIIALSFAFGYEYIFHAVKLTYMKGRTGASIYDGPDFPKHEITAGTAQPWQQDSLYNQIPLPKVVEDYLEKTESAAFLVIKDGKLVSEKYLNGNQLTSHTNSFSMAKSVTVMLAGFAIQDKKIGSMQDLLSKYYDGFAEDPYAKYCTLEDLSAMQSGFNWNENYSDPFSPNAKAYYGNNLAKWVLERKFKEKPETRWEYQSGTTQLLGFVVRKAVDMPLADYASIKLWQPLGMEYGAYWSIDHENGMEKAYCCINATARDFAKLGQLLLNNGSWNGNQLLDPDFVKLMTTGTALSKGGYGNGLWINTDAKIHHYYLRGLYGQYVIVVPEYNMIVVRTGSTREEEKDDKDRPLEVEMLVNEAVKTFATQPKIPADA